MKTITFEGHSDDLLCIGGALQDEVSCNDEIVAVGLSSDSEDAQINILATYAPKVRGGAAGCWFIGIQQVEEGVLVPAWDFEFSAADNDYSPRLSVTVPDDTEIHLPD